MELVLNRFCHASLFATLAARGPLMELAHAPNADTSTSGCSYSTDFIQRTYDATGEPLNLCARGQKWFTHILAHEYEPVADANGLVLGATPWLATLMSRTVANTSVIDINPTMLRRCERSVGDSVAGHRPPTMSFVRRNWLDLSGVVSDLQIVVGDNAFAFLGYPNEWTALTDVLAERMSARALLLCRILSPPATHRHRTVREIVEEALRWAKPTNLTAVRTALLFAHWNATSYTIRPEAALATFDEQRGGFAPLLADAPSRSNDLVSIEKYRGTNALFVAPPLPDALAIFDKRFDVHAVYFGPYELSQYFPIIAATRRSSSPGRS